MFIIARARQRRLISLGAGGAPALSCTDRSGHLSSICNIVYIAYIGTHSRRCAHHRRRPRCTVYDAGGRSNRASRTGPMTLFMLYSTIYRTETCSVLTCHAQRGFSRLHALSTSTSNRPRPISFLPPSPPNRGHLSAPTPSPSGLAPVYKSVAAASFYRYRYRYSRVLLFVAPAGSRLSVRPASMAALRTQQFQVL